MSVNKERAWANLTELSFNRVTGTEDELRAANIILGKCQEAGVDAVLEEYEIDMPEVTEAFLAITSPIYKEYHVIGIGNGGVTDGLECGFKYIENANEANLVDIKDKMVLVQGRTTPELLEKLASKGAKGYINMHGSFYDDPTLIPELRPRNVRGDSHGLVGLTIHINDAEDLVRAKPESIKVVCKADNEKKGKAHNVVAVIEGTDLKDEVLVFSAHYDSVPYSPGAWDNMTGSITIMELMHYYKANPPRRTCKFVWCGSEEIGLVGSRNYCEMHEDELKNIIFNINFDMTGVTLGYECCIVSATKEVENGIKFLANAKGYPVETRIDLYPSDSTSFATHGVPSCSFARLQPHGGAVIHDHRDTMDHLDPDAFMITLNFVVEYSSLLANSDVNMIPRGFDKSLDPKFEMRKKWAKKKEEKKEESK